MYEENEINLKDLIGACLRNLKYIIFSGLIVAIIAFGYTFINGNMNEPIAFGSDEANSQYYLDVQSYKLELETYNFSIMNQKRIIENTVSNINYYNELLSKITYDKLDEFNIYQSYFNIMSSGNELYEINNVFSEDDFLEAISDVYSIEDLRVLVTCMANVNEQASFLNVNIYTDSAKNTNELIVSINKELKNRGFDFTVGETFSVNGYNSYINAKKDELSTTLSKFQDSLQTANDQLSSLEQSIAPVDPSIGLNNNLIINPIIGFILGLFASIGVILVKFLLKDSLLRASDINFYSNLPIFGVFKKNESKGKLLNYLEKDINEFDEESIYKVIAANLNVLNYSEISLISSSVSLDELENLKKKLIIENKDLSIQVFDGDITKSENINNLKVANNMIIVERRRVSKNKNIQKLSDFIKSINKPIYGYIVY